MKSLLLKILNYESNENDLARIRNLTIDDWDEIISQANKHSIGPYLYCEMRQTELLQYVPEQFSNQLYKVYITNTGRNVKLFHGLGKILKTFAEQNIDSILLKGAHLANVVYKTPGARTMDDIDLLLKKKDFGHAQDELFGLGYYGWERQILVDFHWSIDEGVTPINIDMRGVWERTKHEEIEGIKTRVLCPEDVLLHLCHHLAFHHLFDFGGLRTLCDIREIIKHYGENLNWHVLCDRAEEWQIGNTIYVVMLIGKELVEANVPDYLFQRLYPDSDVQECKEWAISKIFHYHIDKATDGLSERYALLFGPDSFREKCVQFSKLLIPASKSMSRKYMVSHRSLKNYLTYLVRFKTHMAKYAHATWKMLRRDEEMRDLIARQNRDLHMRKWLSSKK